MTIDKLKDKLIIRQRVSWSGILLALCLFIGLSIYFDRFAANDANHSWKIWPVLIFLCSVQDMYQFEFNSVTRNMRWERRLLFIRISSGSVSYAQIRSVRLSRSITKSLGIQTANYTVQLEAENRQVRVTSIGMTQQSAIRIYQAIKDVLPVGVHFDETDLHAAAGKTLSHVAMVFLAFFGCFVMVVLWLLLIDGPKAGVVP